MAGGSGSAAAAPANASSPSSVADSTRTGERRAGDYAEQLVGVRRLPTRRGDEDVEAPSPRAAREPDVPPRDVGRLRQLRLADHAVPDDVGTQPQVGLPFRTVRRPSPDGSATRSRAVFRPMSTTPTRIGVDLGG